MHNYHYELGQVLENLELGNSGDRVTALQNKLNDLGYHLTADGSFSLRTESAVKDFQQKAGLMVDGIVGPRTLAALQNASGTYGPISVNVPSAITRVVTENVTPMTTYHGPSGGFGNITKMLQGPGLFGYPVWSELAFGLLVTWGLYRTYGVK